MGLFGRGGSKGGAGAPVKFDFDIRVHLLAPWPPIRDSEKVLISWQRGSRRSGLASHPGSKHPSNKHQVSFPPDTTVSVPATLYKEKSGVGFAKKALTIEVHLVEEKDLKKKLSGNPLGRVVIDLAEYAGFESKEEKGWGVAVGKDTAKAGVQHTGEDDDDDGIALGADASTFAASVASSWRANEAKRQQSAANSPVHKIDEVDEEEKEEEIMLTDEEGEEEDKVSNQKKDNHHNNNMDEEEEEKDEEEDEKVDERKVGVSGRADKQDKEEAKVVRAAGGWPNPVAVADQAGNKPYRHTPANRAASQSAAQQPDATSPPPTTTTSSTTTQSPPTSSVSPTSRRALTAASGVFAATRLMRSATADPTPKQHATHEHNINADVDSGVGDDDGGGDGHGKQSEVLARIVGNDKVVVKSDVRDVRDARAKSAITPLYASSARGEEAGSGMSKEVAVLEERAKEAARRAATAEAKLLRVKSELRDVALLELAVYRISFPSSSSSSAATAPARRLARYWAHACKYGAGEDAAGVLFGRRAVGAVAWALCTAAHARILGRLWADLCLPAMQGSGQFKAQRGDATSRWLSVLSAARMRLCGCGDKERVGGAMGVLTGQVLRHLCKRLDAALLTSLLRHPTPSPSPPTHNPLPTPTPTPTPSRSPPSTSDSSHFDPRALPLGSSYVQDDNYYYDKGLTFGAGAGMKIAVAAWNDWAVRAGVSEPAVPSGGGGGERRAAGSPNAGFAPLFPLLRAAADLLMFPKRGLLDAQIRHEVCVGLSLPIIRRLLERYKPDEAAPEVVPQSLFLAIDAAAGIDTSKHSKKNTNNTTTNHNNMLDTTKSPVVLPPACKYESPPPKVLVPGWSQTELGSQMGQDDAGNASDEDLVALEDPVAAFFGNEGGKNGSVNVKVKEGDMRFALLREVLTWS
eukprot:jgi/Chlat1/2760/Chrsp187S02908